MDVKFSFFATLIFTQQLPGGPLCITFFTVQGSTILSFPGTCRLQEPFLARTKSLFPAPAADVPQFLIPPSHVLTSQGQPLPELISLSLVPDILRSLKVLKNHITELQAFFFFQTTSYLPFSLFFLTCKQKNEPKKKIWGNKQHPSELRCVLVLVSFQLAST